MNRTILSIVLSALLGSIFTLGILQIVQKDKAVKIEHINTPPVRNVAFAVADSGKVVPLDFTAVAEKVMPAVVHIKSTFSHIDSDQQQYRLLPDPFRDHFGEDFFEEFFGPRFRYGVPDGREGPMVQIGTGSGVILNSNGYIITNNHVIDQADEVEVTLHDNRVFKATVVGSDLATDLALIKIDAKDLPTMPLVDSDNAKVGEWVLAVGNPFNLNSTVTAGIISAKGRSINILNDQSAIESFIQTDAAINRGNSGGALVNLQGGLIGINTAIATPTGVYAGYGFAVPSNIVNKVVEDLLKHGSVQRGQLGVFITPVDEKVVKEKELSVSRGVLVDSLAENSAASKAGLKVGDVILEINDREVYNPSELRELVARHKPGDKVELKVDRFGSTKEFTVALSNPNNTLVSSKSEKYNNILSPLGAEFEDVDKKTAAHLDISGGVRVKKISTGKLRKTDMREGFIITAVDGKPVKSVDELAKQLENKKGGVMIEGVYEGVPGTYYYAFGM
jgi:Do/DeqQ family serine protease